MEVLFKNFPPVLLDNEEKYYASLRGTIESVDHTSSMLITKRIQGITVRILPSNCTTLNIIIKEINDLNTLYGLRVDFSKSIKTTCSINFNINF